MIGADDNNDLAGELALPEDLTDRQRFAERLIASVGVAEGKAVAERLGQADEWIHFWINPLAGDPSELPAGEPLPEFPEIFASRDRNAVTYSEAAGSGAIYIQNPSSLFAVTVLDPQPGEEILDLAAAPGGKTIAIGARMENQGRLAAVEVVPGRYHRLRANVERCGLSIVDFYLRDGRGVGRAVPERFDRVLLDAPCSSEARMRWYDPDSYRHWRARKTKETSRKQKGLILSAYAALKPGGLLVYSTCSFALEENERVVQHLLKRTDAQLEEISHDLHSARPGVVDNKLSETLKLSLRILPDDHWDGFYVARIRKP